MSERKLVLVEEEEFNRLRFAFMTMLMTLPRCTSTRECIIASDEM